MTVAACVILVVAIVVVGTPVAAIVYAVLTRGRWWRKEFFSMRVLSFALVGLAVGATTFEIVFVADQASDEVLRIAVEDIESDCDDQLSLLLHADAGVFVDELSASNHLSYADLKRISDYLAIDEATVYDKEGRVVCTTDPGLKVGDAPFFLDKEEMIPFRALLSGDRKVVRQRFRQNISAPGRVMKYFALALPQGGVLQIGYLWETFEREFPTYLQGQFEYRAVCESGFCLVFDGRDRLVMDALGHPGVKGLTAAEVGLTAENLAVPLGEIFRARVFGTPCRCMFYRDKIADRKIMAAVPISEGQGETMALALGVAFVIFAAYLAFRLVLRKFRQQQAKIDALRAAEEKRRTAEMAMARDIQRAELRTDGTEGDGYRLATLMKAAREVGGDFYDYYELPDGRLVVTIADVSGKGIPAAFFMMKARMTLKSCVYSSAGVGEAIAKANVRLARNNPAEMFVTVWIGVYDRRTGELEFVSAGHNPPLLSRRDGSVEWVQAPRCSALGVFETARYQGARMRLEAGDRIFLYTDGVTEAMDPDGVLFGDDRLLSVIEGAEASQIAAVDGAIGAFAAGANQADDITMLELEVESQATRGRRDQ